MRIFVIQFRSLIFLFIDYVMFKWLKEGKKVSVINVMRNGMLTMFVLREKFFLFKGVN